MAAPEDRYIRVGRFNTRYWAAGDNGSPVVLVHGTGQYVEYWASAIEALSMTHKVYALDLLGQGKTDKPPDISYTIDELAAFVKDFMAVLGIEKAHIVGHSLGGGISMRLALNHSQLVDKLVLVDSGGLGRELHMVFRTLSVPFLGELITLPSRAGSEFLLRMFVQDPKTINDEYIELHYQISSLSGWQKSILKTLRLSINLRGQLDNSSDIRRLPSINNPVMVVWGRQDNLVPVAHAQIAAKSIPNAELRIFDNCRHSPPIEYAAEFNRLLLDFLKN